MWCFTTFFNSLDSLEDTILTDLSKCPCSFLIRLGFKWMEVLKEARHATTITTAQEKPNNNNTTTNTTTTAKTETTKTTTITAATVNKWSDSYQAAIYLARAY